MVAPLVIPLAAKIAMGVGGGMMAGGALGSMFGKKKAKAPDISEQLAKASSTYIQNRALNQGLYNELQPLTDEYTQRAGESRLNLRSAFDKGKEDYLSSTEDITDKAKTAMRGNLYSGTFAGLPDALRAVRETSAAGSGIDSGAFQQAVQNVGVDTARTLATGERDIELAGAQNLQEAQQQIFGAYNELSSKLSSMEMEAITNALDTGREDIVRRVTAEMGLNEDEAQTVIDLLNFRASGQLAANTASDANKQAFYNALISGGAGLMGQGVTGMGKTVSQQGKA